MEYLKINITTLSTEEKEDLQDLVAGITPDFTITEEGLKDEY